MAPIMFFVASKHETDLPRPGQAVDNSFFSSATECEELLKNMRSNFKQVEWGVFSVEVGEVRAVEDHHLEWTVKPINANTGYYQLVSKDNRFTIDFGDEDGLYYATDWGQFNGLEEPFRTLAAALEWVAKQRRVKL